MSRKHIILVLALVPFLALSMKRQGEPLENPAPAKRIAQAPVFRLLAAPCDSVIESIVDDIDDVQRGGYIGLESPSLTNKTIQAKLITAAEKGAKVRVFVNVPSQEKKEDKKEIERLEGIYKELRSKNIQVTEVADLHAKRIVIKFGPEVPQKVVYIGSLNMTENSPKNHEVLVRSTEQSLFTESFGDQQRLGTKAYTRPAQPIDFTISRIINSTDEKAIEAKLKVIADLATCGVGDDDYLYIAAYTLDDPAIVDAIIAARKGSGKTIKVIVDGSNWTNKYKINYLKKMVQANVDVHIFNKDQKELATFDNIKLMHIKAIVCKCDTQCLSLVSTSNFTPEVKKTINHDLWEPSCMFAGQMKTILDDIIEKSEPVTLRDFYTSVVDRTPREMGNVLLGLTKRKDAMIANQEEILVLIQAGADLTVTHDNDSTFLVKAAQAANVTVMQALLNAGADINQRTHVGTALMAAANNGHKDIVEALLLAGADMNVQDALGKTVFDYAAEQPYILGFLHGVKFARDNVEQIFAEEDFNQ